MLIILPAATLVTTSQESPKPSAVPYPNVAPQDLVLRSRRRQRPFARRPDGATTGYEDVLIWEGLKELLLARPEETVIFVTADKVFRGANRQLHEDLRTELVGLDIDARRVVLTNDLHRAVNECIARPDRSRWDAVIDLLQGIAVDFVNFAFGWLDAEYPGEPREPGDYTLEIPIAYRQVRLLNIVDGGNPYVGPTDPALAHLDVVLHFEAITATRDLHEFRGQGVEVRLHHLNAGTVTIGFQRRVRLVATGCTVDAERVVSFDDLDVQLVGFA